MVLNMQKKAEGNNSKVESAAVKTEDKSQKTTVPNK